MCFSQIGSVSQQRRFVSTFSDQVLQTSGCLVCSCELNQYGRPQSVCRSCDARPVVNSFEVSSNVWFCCLVLKLFAIQNDNKAWLWERLFIHPISEKLCLVKSLFKRKKKDTLFIYFFALPWPSLVYWSRGVYRKWLHHLTTMICHIKNSTALPNSSFHQSVMCCVVQVMSQLTQKISSLVVAANNYSSRLPSLLYTELYSQVRID